METTVSRDEMKNLFKEAFSEILKENKAFFHDFFLEIVEDIAMGKAIEEGDKGDYVAEKRIFKYLES